MPVAIVGAITAGLMIPVAALIAHYTLSGGLAPLVVRLTIAGTIYVFVGSIETAVYRLQTARHLHGNLAGAQDFDRPAAQLGGQRPALEELHL